MSAAVASAQHAAAHLDCLRNSLPPGVCITLTVTKDGRDAALMVLGDEDPAKLVDALTALMADSNRSEGRGTRNGFDVVQVHQ